MAGSAVASAGIGAIKASQARKQMKEAQKNIDNYQRQTLENTMEGIAVPQQIFNMQQEQLQRSVADSQDMAASAGARGLAFLPGIQQSEFESQQKINAGLEQSLYQLSMARAQDEQRIQAMRERREEQELAGYGAMYEAGRQTYYSGIGDVMQGISGVGQAFAAADLRKAMGKVGSAPAATAATIMSAAALANTIKPPAPVAAISNAATISPRLSIPDPATYPRVQSLPGTLEASPPPAELAPMRTAGITNL
jgi:hypothetical protein